jgi:hypothetical protein
MFDFEGAGRWAREKSLDVITRTAVCSTQQLFANFEFAANPCVEEPVGRR